jgi:predicted small secreted protein
MQLPTNLIELLNWILVIGVPILAGLIVSKFLEKQAWFQNIGSKNAVVIAVSAFLGFIVNLLRTWLIANPEVLAAADVYVQMFLSSLALYLTTQVVHGRAKSQE